MIEILLIHNPFQWSKPIYWFSFLIRVVTCSRYNHAALLIDGVVWEAQADGIRATPFEVWKAKTRRIVKPLTVPVPEKERLKEKLSLSNPYMYGYFDIIPFFWRTIVLHRWLGKAQDWDGQTFMEGYFCSEFVAWALELPEAHLYSPEALQHIKGAEAQEEYIT